MPFGGALTTGIGAGASIFSGLFGASKAKKAAQHLETTARNVGEDIRGATTRGQEGVDTAVKNARGVYEGSRDQANDQLAYGFERQTQQLNPYLDAGRQGLSYLTAAYGPGGELSGKFAAPTAEEAAATPGFRFQLDQGNQALQRSAAAGGGLQSGGTLKALDQYSQGLASTYYQNAYNNALRTFQTNRDNTLGGYLALTGIGQNALSQYNTASQNYGNLSSANIMNTGQAIGNTTLQGSEFNANLGLQGAQLGGNAYLAGAGAQSAGTMGATNAWTNAINGVAGAAVGYLKQKYSPHSYSAPSYTGMVSPTMNDGYTGSTNPGAGYAMVNPVPAGYGYTPDIAPRQRSFIPGWNQQGYMPGVNR